MTFSKYYFILENKVIISENHAKFSGFPSFGENIDVDVLIFLVFLFGLIFLKKTFCRVNLDFDP